MHEYMKRLMRAYQLGIIDKAAMNSVNVGHDDYCGFYHGDECNCDPEITLICDDEVFSMNKNGEISRNQDVH
jgi:hypothetical protein